MLFVRTRWEKHWFVAGTTMFLRGFHLLSRLDPDEKLVLKLFVTARKAAAARGTSTWARTAAAVSL